MYICKTHCTTVTCINSYHSRQSFNHCTYILWSMYVSTVTDLVNTKTDDEENVDSNHDLLGSWFFINHKNVTSCIINKKS